MRYTHDLTEKITNNRVAPRIGSAAISMLLIAAAAVGTSPLARAAEAASTPGVCLEAEASTVDAEAWAQVLEAIEAAVDDEPDFFPDATILSLPDLTQPWEPESVSTVRIGIWGSGAGEPGSSGARLERLAATHCLLAGTSWTTTISHELLQAGAERILAAALLPDATGVPPIREGAEAAIAVEFDPAERRVRTTLEFNVPVGIWNPGGTCWIDDVLGVDAASERVVTSTTTGMRVDPFMESGCQKFQAFMTEGGAGEQALSLLPTTVALTDDTSVSFMAASVEVNSEAIVMSDAGHRPSDP